MKHIKLFEAFEADPGSDPGLIQKYFGDSGTGIIQKFGEDLWNFIEKTQPAIEELAAKLYPANAMLSRNPEAWKTRSWRVLKDREDAFDHQLASAVLASIFGDDLARFMGYLNEIRGGLRIFFKGRPSRGIERFEKFTSGWTEDNANNKIGAEIGNKNRGRDMNFLAGLIQKNIQSNNYYTKGGKVKAEPASHG